MSYEHRPRRSTEIDVKIGKKIRLQRTALKLSQGAVADAIGVKTQQVQKYEAGTDRVSVARLLRLCDALEVSFSFFIDNSSRAKADPAPEHSVDTRRLAILYNKIRSPILKKRLLDFAAALVEEQ